MIQRTQFVRQEENMTEVKLNAGVDALIRRAEAALKARAK